MSNWTDWNSLWKSMHTWSARHSDVIFYLKSKQNPSPKIYLPNTSTRYLYSCLYPNCYDIAWYIFGLWYFLDLWIKCHARMSKKKHNITTCAQIFRHKKQGRRRRWQTERDLKGLYHNLDIWVCITLHWQFFIWNLGIGKK